MLTIFTTPKDFKGHFAIIQENAIASWCKLQPRSQIILVGNGYKVSQIAKKYHVLHIPSVETNEFGTPLLPDIFRKAYAYAKYERLAYVNCDIILTSDFTDNIKRIKLPKFFLTGSRWEFSIKKKLEFQANWQEKLKETVFKKGSQKKEGPTDYFVFSPEINFRMPKLAMGRTYWDAWLIFKAKQLGFPVIDATPVIWAIHQTHDYSHAGGWTNVWLGSESQENKKLIGDKRKYFNCRDADYLLTEDGLGRPRMTLARVVRKIETLPVLMPKIGTLVFPLNFLVRVVRFIKVEVKRFIL